MDHINLDEKDAQQILDEVIAHPPEEGSIEKGDAPTAAPELPKTEENLTQPVSTPENAVKGVMAVIYDHMHEPWFLIMKRQLGWEGWEFVKGRIEPGEDPDKAIQREIVEETGLTGCKSFKKLDITKQFTVEGVPHVFSVYLVEANMNIPVVLPKGPDAEHSSYLWGPKEKIVERLTFDDDQKILDAVLGMI